MTARPTAPQDSAPADQAGNVFWAFAYNIAALPLVASGYLNPLVAGAAMAFSSVFVASDSLRLRRFPSARKEVTQ